MSDGVLRAEDILIATEDALRRFGPEKANVVDVARALGVSHGSVYRHFASKAALRDAVTQRWLARITEPLATIALNDVAPRLRLRLWFATLRALKRAKAADEPELFATYSALASGARDVITAHVEELIAQIAQILRAGISAGEFTVVDPKLTAAALLSATLRFHHPLHAADWGTPENDAAFEAVWALLERALRPA